MMSAFGSPQRPQFLQNMPQLPLATMHLKQLTPMPSAALTFTRAVTPHGLKVTSNTAVQPMLVLDAHNLLHLSNNPYLAAAPAAGPVV
jgi:hypothetical protein